MMDPSAAHGWLLDSEETDFTAVAAQMESVGLASSWAHRDPVAASEAMLALPQEFAGERLGEVVEVWARDDAIAASAFINDRLKPGHVRDKAVTALIKQIRIKDPESAAEWAESITDPDLRSKALSPPDGVQ